MTMTVNHAAHPVRPARRKKAGAAMAAAAHPATTAARTWSPVKLAGTAILPATATAATAPAAPAPAAAATPAPTSAPAGPISSPEYDTLDPAGVVGDISNGVTKDMVGGAIGTAVGNVLDAKRFPFLGSKFGSVIPGKAAGVITGEVGSLVGSFVTDALHGALHHKDAEGKEDGGMRLSPTPANKLVAKFVKGVSTTWMRTLVTEALAPAPAPAPPQTPVPTQPAPTHAVAAHTPSSSTTHGSPKSPPPPPTPIPAQGPRLVATPGSAHLRLDPGHPATDTNNPPPPALKGPSVDIVKPSLPPLSPLLQAGAVGLIGTGISAIYDQVVGPLVQRAANLVTGRADEPVAPPKPLTPGKVVNGFVDGVLGSLLVRSVGSINFGPGKPTPFGVTLGSSIMNNVIGAAWQTVYDRGMGPAIEKGVNQAAGIRSKDEQAKDVLPAGEHFARAATRGVAAGAATFLVGKALWAPIMQLGMHVGGVGGLFIAIAGSSLIGAISGGAVDATVGPMLGKLGGGIYSWITGKPSYEQRAKDAASKPTPTPAPTPANPGPTPGSPVNSPNGNPGTVPAPPAPAAPPAGAPKKRTKTGNKAVDATAPAIHVGPAKLAKLAVATA